MTTDPSVGRIQVRKGRERDLSLAIINTPHTTHTTHDWRSTYMNRNKHARNMERNTWSRETATHMDTSVLMKGHKWKGTFMNRKCEWHQDSSWMVQ